MINHMKAGDFPKTPAKEVQMNNSDNRSFSARLLGRAKREYKDSLFRMIFNDREKLLELYNAVNDTHYTDAEELQIVTLENAIYMNMKNDLAFLMNFRLNLYEHQSTFNPNIPLRDLLYVAREYEKLAADRSLYASTRVRIPTPCFIVFYNGTANQPEERTLLLSDSFQIPAEEPALELRVKMLNINAGKNPRILSQCRLLAEYMEYVDRVRRYALKLNLDEAVEMAVTECIQEGILAEFLTRYRAEAVSVSIFEYNEEKEMALMRQAEYDAGVRDGIQEGIEKGIREGESRLLIKMICRKLKKGEDPGSILAELEEDGGLIRKICEIAQSFAPEYDCDKIYKSLSEQEK